MNFRTSGTIAGIKGAFFTTLGRITRNPMTLLKGNAFSTMGMALGKLATVQRMAKKGLKGALKTGKKASPGILSMLGMKAAKPAPAMSFAPINEALNLVKSRLRQVPI